MQNWCELVDSHIRTEFPRYDFVLAFSALSVRNDALGLHMPEPLATMCGLDFDTMSAELHGLWPLVQELTHGVNKRHDEYLARRGQVRPSQSATTNTVPSRLCACYADWIATAVLQVVWIDS